MFTFLQGDSFRHIFIGTHDPDKIKNNWRNWYLNASDTAILQKVFRIVIENQL